MGEQFVFVPFFLSKICFTPKFMFFFCHKNHSPSGMRQIMATLKRLEPALTTTVTHKSLINADVIGP